MKINILLILFLTIISCPTKAQEASATAHLSDSIHQKMSIVNYRIQPKNLILPASLITVGAVATAIDGMGDFHLFSRKDSVKRIHVDNYMEWGMLGWVFVCDLMGEEKHNWVDQLFLVALAEGINGGMVQWLKKGIHVERPDGRPRSFPSGHTANSFLGAHVAYKEFKDTSPFLAYSGYALATLVGVSRIYNNRHWVADVLAGAGIGILSVELSYLIYFPIRNAIARKVNSNATRNLMVAPMMTGQGGGLYISYTF